MPNQNGTGPFGDGRPGRGIGPCGRFIRGCRGFRRGFGLRRRGNWSNEPIIPNQTEGNDIYAYNRTELEAQKNELEKQLKWLNEQLNDNKED